MIYTPIAKLKHEIDFLVKHGYCKNPNFEHHKKRTFEDFEFLIPMISFNNTNAKYYPFFEITCSGQIGSNGALDASALKFKLKAIEYNKIVLHDCASNGNLPLVWLAHGFKNRIGLSFQTPTSSF